MRMIIGGAFQGKLAYAQKLYPELFFIEGENLTEEELFKVQGIHGFHNYIRKEMKAGKDVSALAAKLIQNNPDVVLISDEVGYGVVPMDAFDRAYREAVGRICTELAAYSDVVIRVALGIGTEIKHA